MKNKRRLIFYILWGAILFSNFVFLAIVQLGFLDKAQSAQISDLATYSILSFTTIAAIASITLFIKASSRSKIIELSRDLVLELPPLPNQTQVQREQFSKMPDVEKKKILIEQKSFILLIFSWVLGEAINMAGIYYLILGGTKSNHSYFFVAAIIIHLKNFPMPFFKKLDAVIK